MSIHNHLWTSVAARLLLLIALPHFTLAAQIDTDRTVTEPELSFIYPLGGSAGSTVQAVIEGRGLDGVHAVWFAQEGLTANVKTLEAIDRNDSEDGENQTVISLR